MGAAADYCGAPFVIHCLIASTFAGRNTGLHVDAVARVAFTVGHSCRDNWRRAALPTNTLSSALSAGLATFTSLPQFVVDRWSRAHRAWDRQDPNAEECPPHRGSQCRYKGVRRIISLTC